MLDKKPKQLVFGVDLHGQPASLEEITSHRRQLKSTYRDYLNYVLAVFVLAAGVSYRAISLGFEEINELFEIGLYIGLWIGLFTGFNSGGNAKHRVQIVLVSIIVSTSASQLAAMFFILFIGHVTDWITAVNILASALASMWILTHYDIVMKGLDFVKDVNQQQHAFVETAAARHDVLKRFHHKISNAGRLPLAGEYWAIRDWLKDYANKT